MKQNFKFGKFEDMRNGALSHSSEISADLSCYAARAIVQSQRFYLPHGQSIVEGKSIRDLAYALHLPFERVALLTEGQYEDSKEAFSRIICAEYLGDDRNTIFYQTVSSHFQGKEDEVSVVSPRYFVRVCAEGDRLEYGLGPNSQIVLDMFCDKALGNDHFFNPDDDLHQMFGAIDAANNLVNLMVLLSLGNVEADRIDVPAKLAKKRKASGRRPLYAYHVLKVDGLLWHEPGSDNGDGLGYRSHLRRGHIRRISSDRAIWVRAAFVHGRVPGFVDKDYQVDNHA